MRVVGLLIGYVILAFLSGCISPQIRNPICLFNCKSGDETNLGK